MTEQNLHWLSATEMAASVASNSLSPNEIAEAMIQRVDAVNPSINAIVQFDREQVTRDAAELSRQQEAGEKLGPLHGVPFTIKDLTAVDGLPTTFGMKPMADNIATGNAVVVDRLRGSQADCSWERRTLPKVVTTVARTTTCTGRRTTRGSSATARAGPVAVRRLPWLQASGHSPRAVTARDRCVSRRRSAGSSG